VGTDGFFIARREQIASLAAHFAVPGIYPFPDFPAAGGLASYGASLADAYRQAGVYAGRVLKGAKPADLPITQPVNSSWSSTSRPRKHSASKFRRQCSPEQTR